ncbi:hypothetical protein T01_13048 [Trichinella spiralis]|uniref:Uncharacterized protein n=1 Tax=Trichinella spiralis TaxID=6334 RepID=A0A0V1C1U8_TRISP|nr:hypothetical protein T01_13048 [Trichinella spiralis]
MASSKRRIGPHSPQWRYPRYVVPTYPNIILQHQPTTQETGPTEQRQRNKLQRKIHAYIARRKRKPPKGFEGFFV